MLASHQFNSVRNAPALSKRAMLAQLGAAPARAKLAARNTLDYVDADGVRRIRLHATDILTIRADGAFEIDTGGWNTVTTRARLNDFLPGGWRVYTYCGRIYLRRAGADAPSVPFIAQVSVSASGKVTADLRGIRTRAGSPRAGRLHAHMEKARSPQAGGIRRRSVGHRRRPQGRRRHHARLDRVAIRSPAPV